MRTSFATHNHGAHVNTNLHRAAIVDVEADDYCAPEGGCCRDENQGRGPDCPQHPRKAERTEVAKFWRDALGFGIALVSVLLLVHWGVSK